MHALVALISTFSVAAGGAQCRPASASWAAVALHPTTVFAAPERNALARFGVKNVNGARTVFSVLGCRSDWLRVELPMRPNGAVGWVRARDVALARVHARIVVELGARRLRLYQDGRLRLTATVAVGSPSTPTPTGRYYVNQELIPSDPTGPYGPVAVGISAFSNVLTGWAQGGPIAIHGTNEPWSIGRAASHGCIRLPNHVLRRVFAQTPVGTPVVIRD
jgi:lipoprotein-anchoring transpeptidase ErfK/SrfK